MHRGRVILSEQMELKWLAMVLVAFLLGGCSDGCWEEERFALFQLKPFFSFVDDTSHWVEGKENSDCCEWERVECNTTTGRVIRLFLNLTDTEAWHDLVSTTSTYEKREYWYLNASLFLPFEELRSLYLSGNFIAGCVANQGFERLSPKLDKLEILDLNTNYFNNNILTSLSELSSLKSLNLAANQLTSSDPTYGIKRLSKLNNLEILDLRDNILGNNILSHLDDFISLKSLRLQGCGLEGTVDLLEFNNLMNLKELYLGENRIKSLGFLSQEKEKLKLIKLEVLDLSENLFNNNIFSSLSVFSNLKSLYLDQNNLKGSIHIKDLNALSNLKELTFGANEVNEFVPSQEKEQLKLIKLEVLELSENMFNNSIFSFLGMLSNLKSLNLDDNNLKGTIHIKDLNALSNLEGLTLSGNEVNEFVPVKEKEKLKLIKLDMLDLSENFFNNSIFSSLSVFSNLKFLFLHGNKLKGPMHIKDLNALSNLEALILSNNEVNEFVPSKELRLMNLKILDLDGNLFNNSILSSLGRLSTLKSLFLRRLEFKGLIDIKELDGLSNLEDLNLDCNYEFSSPIAKDINCSVPLQSLGLFPSLKNLFLSGISLIKTIRTSQFQNKLHNFTNLKGLILKGSVQSVEEFTSLKLLDLTGCEINRNLTFQDWQILTNLEELKISGSSLPFNFMGTLTSLKSLIISYSDINDGNFSINDPVQMRNLEHLEMIGTSLENNFLQKIGAMPSIKYLHLQDCGLSGTLHTHGFCGMTNLQELFMDRNNLTGNLPECLSNFTSLESLYLSSNHFFGRIPDLSNCSFLTELDVSNNKLIGGIPKWMENMSSLSTLDLSNNNLSGWIPRWTKSMSSLKVIVMANNHLEGPIPMEFCHLNLNLELLDLSVNDISGRLPSCFRPLWISQVHLSRNKLEGPLPNVFRNSTILVTLDLSNNHLTGKIPNWIGKLSQLSFLLLNNNHFQGGIPVQLCNLGHLSVINLSNNNLSGIIPPCLKITTFDEISQDYYKYVETVTNSGSYFSTEEPIEFPSKKMSYSYKGIVLTYLSGIDFSCNNLTGEIPHEVKNFRNIYALNLSYNSLTGPIPLAFSDLKQIESLDLSYNNLNGRIPPQLVGLYSLSYFNVAYNNLSGSTPEWIAQFATFDESSYVGNPFLCGTPLPNNCSTSRPSSFTLPKASTNNGPIDMYVFYVCFVVSYIIALLTIASVLYINPYWRQAWFYHIEVVSNSSYYFVEDYILPKRFNCGNM